jgi:DNA repair protein RecO (recombination protein O)
MSRSATYSALVLRLRPSGESNREAWFLTAEEGILRATVFGGPKSRFRSHVAPYHRGILWTYHDPVRDSRKVTDFDVCSWRPGIRELYERTAAAAAVAETILAGHGGGGSWALALALADRTLDALEGADEGASRRIFIHFLWNWAELSGIQPELDRCVSCGKRFGMHQGERSAETGGNAGDGEKNACGGREDEVLWYSRREGGLLCPSCTESSANKAGEWKNGLLPVGPGARRWLAAAAALDASLLNRYTLDGTSEEQARAFTTGLLAEITGKGLASWKGW